MFLNKYKLENLAKHNLNNDITSNSNLEFIKDKIYLDNNYKDLDKKENYKKTKKANTKLLWTSGNAKYATVNAKGIVTTKKSAKGKTVKITAMASVLWLEKVRRGFGDRS